MCCFSRAVPFVGGTQIFARLGSERGVPVELLAYSMNVRIDEALAMVLPLPVPRGSADDAVRFISLEDSPRFFAELGRAFPQPQQQSLSRSGLAAASAPIAPTLEVHRVGRFDASFVPSRRDFSRLDERFRLPESFFAGLPGYDDWGFAVFKLSPRRGIFGRARAQSVHPMALVFPTREPEALFFPTVHLHDGVVSAEANFDHTFYCQAGGVLGATLDWERSADPFDQHCPGGRTSGLLAPSTGGFRGMLSGQLPNRDYWLRPPAGVTEQDLTGSGECYRYSIGAGDAYPFAPFDQQRQTWKQTALGSLQAVCKRLPGELATLVAEHRQSWQLAPITEDQPRFFLLGDSLWRGPSYQQGHPATQAELAGGGRLCLTASTERLGAQTIELGFARMPSVATLLEVRAALARLLERLVPSS